MSNAWKWVIACGVGIFGFGCAHVSRPCSEGNLPGQEPRELSREEKLGEKPVKRWTGNKRCDQKKDQVSGQWLNHGPYIEWFPNGARALVGEYQMGQRHGIWREYDQKGTQLSEHWFEAGVEVPKRDSPSNASAPSTPAAK